MAITIYDVARKTGLSHGAVAAVLAGRQRQLRISDTTAQRIRKAAEELGYYPNAIAQAFTRGRTNVVGLILSSPRREFLGRILAGAMAAANENALLLKTIATEEGYIRFEAALEQCLQHRVAGLLVCDLQVSQASVPQTLGREIPVCWINCNPQKQGFTVDPDDRAGAMLAVDHLVQLGHRRIAFLAGAKGAVGTVDHRREGFLAGMRKHKLAVPRNFAPFTGGSREIVAARARDLLQRADRPTAILCATDPRAATTLQVAQELGLRVPQELSLIGFSDDTLAQYTTPPLTTIRQPHAQLGRLAISLLLQAIQGLGREIARENILPTELLIRESTAAPAAGARWRYARTK